MPDSKISQQQRGLASQVSTQQVFESGTAPIQTAAEAGAAAAPKELVLPGSLSIGQQVRVIPASTALADALAGASKGLQSAAQGWEQGLVEISKSNLSQLQRDYLDRKNQGYDDLSLQAWLKSTNFKPDRWNRDQYAGFQAEVIGKGRDQWEQDDFLDEVNKFSDHMIANPSPIAQREYLKQRAEQTGNQKVIKWSLGRIAEINQEQAKAAVSMAQMVEMDAYAKNFDSLKGSPLAIAAIVDHPYSEDVMQGVLSGAITWDSASGTLRRSVPSGGLLQPNDPIDGQTPLEYIQGVNLSYSSGQSADLESRARLMSARSHFMDQARNAAIANSDKSRMIAAGMIDRAADQLSPTDYLRVKLADPRNDTLKLLPHDSVDYQAAMKAILIEGVSTQVSLSLKNNEDLGINERVLKALEFAKIPDLPEFQYLLTTDKDGNKVPNEQGAEALSSVHQALHSIVVSSEAESAASFASSVNESAKTSMAPAALYDSLFQNTTEGLKALGLPYSVGPEGIIKFPAYDVQTRSGEALGKWESQYRKAMETISKRGQIAQIFDNPSRFPPSVTAGALDADWENIPAVQALNNADVTDAPIQVVLNHTKSLSDMVYAMGHGAKVPDKIHQFVTDRLSNTGNPKQLMIAGQFLNDLHPEQRDQIIAKLNPQQQLLAYSMGDTMEGRVARSVLADLPMPKQGDSPARIEQIKMLQQNAMSQITGPTLRFMSNLQGADTVAVSNFMETYDDWNSDYPSNRINPADLSRFKAIKSAIIDNIGSSGSRGLQTAEDVEQFFHDPRTKGSAHMLVARIQAAENENPNEPITPDQVAIAFRHITQGVTFWHQTPNSMVPLQDPGQLFDEALVDNMEQNWTTPESLVGGKLWKEKRDLQQAFASQINTLREYHGKPPVGLYAAAPLPEYVDAFMEISHGPKKPGERYVVDFADSVSVQSALVSETDPGVPLVVKIYNGSTFSDVSVPLPFRAKGGMFRVGEPKKPKAVDPNKKQYLNDIKFMP